MRLQFRMFYLFIISLFCLGAIFALSGVALGGWLVYRTKRDSYDPLFSRSKTGEAFNINDDLNTGEEGPVDLPEPTKGASDAFIKQFEKKMGETYENNKVTKKERFRE